MTEEEKTEEKLRVRDFIKKVYERSEEVLCGKKIVLKEPAWREYDSDWDPCRGTSHCGRIYESALVVKVQGKTWLMAFGRDEDTLYGNSADIIVAKLSQESDANPKKAKEIITTGSEQNNFWKIGSPDERYAVAAVTARGRLVLDPAGLISKHIREWVRELENLALQRLGKKLFMNKASEGLMDVRVDVCLGTPDSEFRSGENPHLYSPAWIDSAVRFLERYMLVLTG